MDIQTFVFQSIGVLGVIGSIYQFAVIRESRKRRHELQYLIAGVNQIALSQALAWNNQLSTFPPPKDEKDVDVIRLHIKGRDNAMEISAAISALESVIDTETSAISAMLKKQIEQNKLNNQLQTVALENPTLPQNKLKSP